MPPKRKNKNSGKSPFFHLLVEVQNKHKVSMLEATEIAGEMWDKMSAQERLPYEVLATRSRNNIHAKKFSSDGVDLDDIDQKLKDETQWQQKMMNFIHNDIKDAYSGDMLLEKLFFIIDFNVFCLHEANGKYYPSEVSLVAFSLKDGVLPENVYHAVIKPGDLPLGYYGTAMRASNESHRLPPPSGADDNPDNQEEIFNEIRHFVNDRYDGTNIPVFYTKEKYMPQAQRILEQWSLDYDSSVCYEVYNLQHMFNTLKSTLMGEVMPESYAFHEISKDVYSHAPSIACEFHVTIDAQEYCARSKAVRYAFVICDNCTAHFNVVLVPGHHIPENARIGFRSASSFSGYTTSSRASSTIESQYDGDSDTESTSTMVSVSTSISEAGWTPVQRRPKLGVPTNAALTSITNRLNQATLRSRESDGNVSTDSNAASQAWGRINKPQPQPQLSDDDAFPPLGGKQGHGN